MLVIKTLEQFGKKVVKESRQNLTKKRINATKDLYNSLEYKINKQKGNVIISFSMADYGEFIDKGVKGSQSDAKAPKSPFKYTNKMPPVKAFSKWSIKKGIAPRNAKGQFQSRKSLQFAIARSVFLKGIKTTNFFTKPLEDNFDKLSEDIINSFANDIQL